MISSTLEDGIKTRESEFSLFMGDFYMLRAALLSCALALPLSAAPSLAQTLSTVEPIPQLTLNVEGVVRAGRWLDRSGWSPRSEALAGN